MDLELSGKTVLVTGGSKGIGLACAEAFAAEGCQVHIVARTADELARQRDRLQAEHGVKVVDHALDLSSGASVDELVERCTTPDIVVNNAGAIPGGDLDAVDEARWREGWDLKVFGYVNMTRRYLPMMRERGYGTIVNVVGLAGEKFDAGYVAGSAGNAALMAFTRAVGGTSLDHGVRVVAVSPGPTETDRIATLLKGRAEREHGDPSRWKEYLQRLPGGRAALPREVADVVVFLASERASYVSGVVVTIDGGQAAAGSSF
jgi:NAD(P)-dependent dehydrogenase (short-subunit alcohol dehydrogenase family)